MPQLDLYFSEDDSQRFTEFLIDEGASLVPDLHYDEQNYLILNNIQAVKDARTKTKLFFIIHNSYFFCPLEMRPLNRSGESFSFFIMQRNGGPTIDFYSPGEVQKGGSVAIGPGFVGYHGTFWNTRTQQNERSPKTQIAFYRKLTNWIKTRRGERAVGKHRTWFIGPHALEAEKRGLQLVHLPSDVKRLQ
jgi:hypothetical protein